MLRAVFVSVLGTVASTLTFGTAYEIGIDYTTAKLRVRCLFNVKVLLCFAVSEI
jgi:hypothetical protein